jgi:predicted MFS family arabinose efflux permease
MNEQQSDIKLDTILKSKIHFSKYQIFVVGVLAFLQFTIILDFMILSPLGAFLLPALSITPSQFGRVVSVYAFSAGLSGILAAGFADRFDRKKMLLFFYSGFILGTLLCGIAPNYEFLLMARMITGLFGGVISSIVFAITTDLFPLEARGRVMGFIQTAFAASQILGLPIGLFLANHWGWHMPFILIVIISAIASIIIWKYLKPIKGHLVKHTDQHPLHHFVQTIKNPKYLKAFAATALLSTGGFMIMPFASAFSVHNLGIDMSHLPMVYMTTGFCSILIGPFIGRASDAYGKFNTFLFGSIVTIIMVLIYTHLGPTSLPLFMFINALMFVGISSRMIPSQALMSAVPAPLSRGSFMSISSSLQQISGGLASLLAGLIVKEGVGGHIEHFDILGFVVVGSTLITLYMMYGIHKKIHEKYD